MVKSGYIIAPLAIALAFSLATLGYLYLTLPCFWRGCLPDLRVENYTTNYVDWRYYVDVTVINDGCAESDECMVYCNAISMAPPVGQEIRVQRRLILEGLPSGETATLSIWFEVEVLMSERVDMIEIEVDPKHMVEESNENNNIEWWTY
jgi:hypothetical protein